MLTASLIAAAFALAGDLPAGVVKVTARVQDEHTQKLSTRLGTGALLEKDGKYYVLTAAHVSMGQSIEIAAGEKLEIKSRALHATDDLEWIEVAQPKGKAFASWEADCQCFRPLSPPGKEFHNINTVRDAYLPRVPWAHAPQELSSRNPRQHFLLPTNSNEREGLEPITGRRLLPARLVGGLSGGPLVMEDLDGKLRLAGLAQSYDRAFDVSYFGSEKAIARIATAPPTDTARWRLRNGVSFLDFGGGIEETVPVQIPVSKANTDEGGKANTDEGGKGNTDEGGKGNTDEGGKGNTDEGSKPNTDEGGKSDTDEGTGATNPNPKVKPGILVHGQPAIAIRLKGDSESAFFYADRAAIELVRKNEVEIVRPGDPLQKLLTERLGNNAVGAKFYTMGSGAENRYGASLELLKNGVRLELPLVDLSTGETDFVSVELDERGIPNGAKEFNPVIEVKSKRGKSFYLDLRSFYFRHLAWEGFRTSEKFPVIHLRSKTGRSEFHFGFDRRNPPEGGLSLSGCSKEELETLGKVEREWLERMIEKL